MKSIHILVYSLIEFLTLLLSSTLISNFLQTGLFPNLAFAVLVYFSFKNGPSLGLLLGIVTGLIADCFSSGPFGFYIFVMSLSGYAIGRFVNVVKLDFLFIPLLIVSVSMLSRFVLILILSWVLGLNFITDQLFTLNHLFELFSTIVLSPLIFLLLRLMDKVFQQRGYKSL